ncbi:MAG: hypothetical protein ACOH2O_08720 [Pseudomonas sp.]
MSFETFLSDVLATVIGGGLLALVFFLIKEKFFRYKDMDGSWIFEQMTLSSAYNPFKGMMVRYLVLIARDGNKLYGSAEKNSRTHLGRSWP